MADTHECSTGCAYCRKLEGEIETIKAQAFDAIRELGRELRKARQLFLDRSQTDCTCSSGAGVGSRSPRSPHESAID